MDLVYMMELGLEGKNIGVTTGEPLLDNFTLGIRKGTITAIAAMEKVGKSKFTRYHHIFHPYINYLKTGKKVNWRIYSLEETIKGVTADLSSTLIKHFSNGTIPKKRIMGTEMDKEGNQVKLTIEEQILVRRINIDHVQPLFGVYEKERQIKPGLIEFTSNPVTPKQFEMDCLSYLNKRGRVVFEQGAPIKYEPNEDILNIFIVDDVRLMKKIGDEKQTVDAVIEVMVNQCQNLNEIAFIPIIHLNRTAVDWQRLKEIGKQHFYPSADLIKSTANVSERAHQVITLHNPNAPGFETPLFFGKHTKPNQRSIHLVTSRDTEFPNHLLCNFDGATNHFTNYQVI